MKKLSALVAVILALTMLVSFTACQEVPQATETSSEAPAQTSAAVESSTEASSAESASAESTDSKEAERMALAQQYKNAEPGESFLVGHITFQLEQEYAMMVLQANKQAAEQLGLKFQSYCAKSDAEWIQDVQSLIAAGAKAITLNCPSLAAMPEMVKLCNDAHVFLGTYFGYSGDMFPGDLGAYWVLDHTPLSDEQTYLPLMILMEKMKENGKTKLLVHQASKTSATVSTVYINLGCFMAWKNYPEIELLGHQYGEWGYEGGRSAAEASLATRQDYEGFWGANDSQTTGALKALSDRGLDIGPYTASRDMEMTTAEEIINGNFLCTAGFAIPYYGGRLMATLYDMCVGAWYPFPEEMLQTGRVTIYGGDELADLAKNSGVDQNPSYQAGPTQENLDQILMKMKDADPEYPYDFRLVSISKCEELGLTYDRHAGGDTSLGALDWYYPASLNKFGSLDAFKAHVSALYEYFLDFNCDTWEEAEEYAKQFPSELKIDPTWE